MSDWQYLPPHGMGVPGAPTQQGGGGGSTGGVRAIMFRDPLDAQRAQMGGPIPASNYPDGYLGTIQSRREDRLLSQLHQRAGQRSDQRGVHKGERIDPADYEWPPELDEWRGLRRQAQTAMPMPDGTVASLRAAPMGTMIEQLQAYGDRLPMTPRGKMRPMVPEGAPDEVKRKALAAMLPDWRT